MGKYIDRQRRTSEDKFREGASLGRKIGRSKRVLDAKVEIRGSRLQVRNLTGSKKNVKFKRSKNKWI